MNEQLFKIAIENAVSNALYKTEIMNYNPDIPGGYEPPPSGDLAEKGKHILAKVYAECRRDGGDKEKCAKIAWGAVHKAGFK